MGYKDLNKRKEYQRNWQKKKDLEYRLKSLEILGNKCVMCGNNDYRVLQIDHIKPLKRQSYKDFPLEAGSRIRCKIALGKRSIADLQLLCANCHQIKTLEEYKK